jgi:hypothetical protein
MELSKLCRMEPTFIQHNRVKKKHEARTSSEIKSMYLPGGNL